MTVIPFLIKELEFDEVVYGWFSSLFSLMMLFGGPIIGYITDMRGSVFALQIS